MNSEMKNARCACNVYEDEGGSLGDQYQKAIK
jgi:hypothetical protein